MVDNWKNIWNERYQEEGFAYGSLPNQYLKEQIDKLPVGKILFAAEGEGRNAVYAAQQGWKVEAFDISEEGRKKAEQLANQNQVSIQYQVGLLPELSFEHEPFDAIALIYAHFPPQIRSEYHRLLNQKLKVGGTIIFEAFGKNNLEYRKINPGIGGPQDPEWLFTVEDIKQDFSLYEIIELEEQVVTLAEGKYHNGQGSVVRFTGRKVK